MYNNEETGHVQHGKTLQDLSQTGGAAYVAIAVLHPKHQPSGCVLRSRQLASETRRAVCAEHIV